MDTGHSCLGQEDSWWWLSLEVWEPSMPASSLIGVVQGSGKDHSALYSVKAPMLLGKLKMELCAVIIIIWVFNIQCYKFTEPFSCSLCQTGQPTWLIEVNGGRWQTANTNEFFLTLPNMYFIPLGALLFV